ncbi:transcription initiation factor [Mycena metata]|uniref:Transcription initiation factor IIF subunit alpha n=1 Tax=Mycena metata TaxID=1033252 RepID=A0AAD7K9N8_9AGAR|nr:transcription initiation factor [Mycena metata]
MGPKPNVALLFHPKKGAKKDTPPTSPPKKPSAPRPKPIPNDDEEELKLPDAPFQEFKVMSSALNGWKYDVMKFDSRKPVDLTSWPAPIKLNRKEMRRDDASGTQVAVGPMLGLDGKPVVGPDGKFVMVDADGKPIHAESAKDPKDKGPAVNGKKKFQKKTRQVYVVPEEVRQLRREERYPWVMEDATQAETWVGQLEDTSKSGTHAFFMPAANDIFKFVPAHRWYKFQKKLKHADLPTDTLTMESAYTNNQKRDPQQWLYNRNGKGPSSETAAMFKAESEGRALAGSSSLVHSSGQSLGPNGRKLKTVDSGMSNLFGEGDDEDGDAKRRREKEYGGDGDMDEIVFEEDFADDDEKVDLEAEDEETKDIEERLKKEYKSANKQRDGHIDESDDEDMPGMSKQAKAMQKLIRNREGNDAYDSDDEKNPYASSEEEEEEAPPEPVVLQPPVPPQPPADSRGGSQAPGPQAPIPPARPQAGGSKVGSRATSPVASPGLGGHSVVAKRATSPKAHKQKSNGASRGNSPLASRATSPVTNSRATSPVAGGAAGPTMSMHAGSPSPTSPNGAPPKAKKRKAHNGGVVPVGELEDKMVIEWLRNTPNATTRDCIQHFQPYLTDEAKKSKFTALIKEVAQLKGGVVVLRSAYSGT